MTLADLGWNDAFETEFAPFHLKGWKPARLIRDNKISYGALTIEDKQIEEFEVVIMCGKVYHDAETDADLPAVGDWVALEVGGENEETIIRARLKRQTCLSRKQAGESTEEQVIAANVSVVVVVTDAGPDLSLRRMERYFAVIGRSGAKAVVLVNKSDLYQEGQSQSAAEAIRALNADAEVYVTSVEKKKGLRPLKSLIKRGVSVAIIGSSGVGKSALVNYLLGDDWQWIDEVNAVTGKGRHTTTARELLVLNNGGIIIDNPGIKEVQMWTNEITLRERFADIEALAQQCKYRDCKHGSDAGCAIRAAVENGQMESQRYEGFLRLDDEIQELRRRRKKRQMTVERRNKRDHKVKARNRQDRIDHERDLKPRAGR